MSGIKEVLNYLKMPIVREDDDDYYCQCPFHTIGRKKSSLGIHKEKGYWHCYVCSEAGIIERLVSKKLGISIPEAMKIVKGKFDMATSNPEYLDTILRDIPENWSGNKKKIIKVQEEILESELLLYDDFHPYLLNRNISKQTQKEFEIGYDKWYKRITFPIRNEKGKLVGLTGRTVLKDVEPRYYFYTSYEKRLVLYNLNKVKKLFPIPEDLILVEGTVDCMWLWQIGVKNVVASFGSSLSKAQSDLIVNNCKTLYVLYDADGAGIDGRERVRDLLGERIVLKDVILPDGYKDIVGVMKPEVEKMLKQADLIL